MEETVNRLFARHFDTPAVASEPISGHGSNRRMLRVRGESGQTAIAVIGPEPEENRAFLAHSKAFRSIQLPVPEIYAADEGAGIYLVEDLGDTSLFDALQAERDRSGEVFPARMLPIYERVLAILPRFQVEGGRVIDFALAYPHGAFDRRSMQWDLNYFKYHFLKLVPIPFHEDRLERDFQKLVSFLLEAYTSHFLYRDFQSRNVMLRGDEPWFIDFQGGRRGALQYDVASMLYDAKAAIPEPVRERLFGHYLDALEGHIKVDRERFRAHYRGYVLIRILQAMGAYGYRGFYERKSHFLKSVPFAVENLDRLLAEGLLPFETPELAEVLERICAAEGLRSSTVPRGTGLTVRVGSFSYRRGYPPDPAGHGGGFVFDCRAIQNPGRKVEYAGLSGLDRAVIEYLERLPESDVFLGRALDLVRDQVRVYLGRGFGSLSVQFGCTGGQHRSVYFAERLAQALRDEFLQIHVDVIHGERGVWPGGPSSRSDDERFLGAAP